MRTHTLKSQSSHSHSSVPFFNSRETVQPFFSQSFIQPKLTIGQHNDIYEKQANAMADKVTRTESSLKFGGAASPTILQRRAAPGATTPRAATTRIPHCGTRQSERIQSARERAIDYLDVAISRLRNAPRARSTYATALARHFIAPTAANRATIRATYIRMRRELRRRRNFRCHFRSATCGPGTQAFWDPADDLVHICRNFFSQGTTCRAIILIHEVAHDLGVDAAPGAHAPNRGSAGYPAGNTAPPPGQTTAGRMNNPDAYAFFAAHVWRSTDTSSTCF